MCDNYYTFLKSSNDFFMKISKWSVKLQQIDVTLELFSQDIIVIDFDENLVTNLKKIFF